MGSKGVKRCNHLVQKAFLSNTSWTILGRMTTQRITVLLILFIFGFVSHGWADTVETMNTPSYQESIGKMEKPEESGQSHISQKDDAQAVKGSKFELRSFLEGLKTNHKLKLIDSIDKIVSLHKVPPTVWIYKLLDLQGVKEKQSLSSESEKSILRLPPNGNRYVDERRAKVTFELLESKIKKREVFMFFHLALDSKGEGTFLEMQITPSSERGVNFFIPF